MLHSLTIDNVVLIEHQVLELGSGFNVLTGETGAGKSMVVDALDLVLGGRAQPQVVRTGEREAEVAALFEVESGSRVAAKLEAAGVPCDGELVVRRVVQAEGRSVTGSTLTTTRRPSAYTIRPSGEMIRKR